MILLVNTFHENCILQRGLLKRLSEEHLCLNSLNTEDAYCDRPWNTPSGNCWHGTVYVQFLLLTFKKKQLFILLENLGENSLKSSLSTVSQYQRWVTLRSAFLLLHPLKRFQSNHLGTRFQHKNSNNNVRLRQKSMMDR